MSTDTTVSRDDETDERSWIALSVKYNPSGLRGFPAPYNGGPPLHRQAANPATPSFGREKCPERERRMLASRTHPRTALPLAAGDEPGAGKHCRDCAHLVRRTGTARPYPKCLLTEGTWTGGRASDCLLGWPACIKFQPKEDGDHDGDHDGDA